LSAERCREDLRNEQVEERRLVLQTLQLLTTGRYATLIQIPVVIVLATPPFVLNVAGTEPVLKNSRHIETIGVSEIHRIGYDFLRNGRQVAQRVKRQGGMDYS
jgi:hypothetical protein